MNVTEIQEILRIINQTAYSFGEKTLNQCQEFPICTDIVERFDGYSMFAVPIACGALIFLLIICCKCGKSRVRTNSVPLDDDNGKQKWNVFDLAKTANEPGHTLLVIRLVEKYGYDVNYVLPSTGLSLFLCACLSGEKQLVSYMIERGADITIKTKGGDSPLYLATYGILSSPQPDISIIQMLIKAGCGVNTQNYRGYTPLHRAASKGNITVIKTLLKLGADPYICSKSGIYPIDSALNAGHHEAVELLQIKLDNPHVWDVIDHHTPPRIMLGLQSPSRRHLMESSRPKTASKVLN